MIKLQAEMLLNAKRQTKVNSTRVRNMYKMQERLRKRFIEVNSFIKDCVDKKRAAEKITSEETIYHRELGEGIESFTSSIGELKAFREALKATVQEFQPYEKVLDEVVKSSHIFESQQDCIDRCDALSKPDPFWRTTELIYVLCVSAGPSGDQSVGSTEAWGDRGHA